MRLPRSRGIVLISVMFIAILIGMYILSADILNRSRFGGVRQTAENRLAEEAARSGMEYALARLEENPDWRGDKNGVAVDSPELLVVENNGNVVGILKNDVGTAQFRLRFNHQDGTDGTDKMDDPDATMWLDTPHISQNNLLGKADALFYLGDGANNSASTILPNVVEPGAVALVVEGRVSRGFEAADANDPNPNVTNVAASRVVEGFYRVNDITNEALTDAVSMAGGKFDAELFDGEARMLLDDTRDNSKPTIRVRNGNMTVKDHDSGSNGALEGVNGEIRVKDAFSVNADLGTGMSTESEDSNDTFYQLAWNDVSQPSTGHTLQAGVYEVRQDGKIYRYDMNFEDYKSYKYENPNDEGSLGVQANLDGSNAVEFIAKGQDFHGEPSDKNRVVFTDDILIESSGDVVDLTIIPAQGAKEDLNDNSQGEWTYVFQQTNNPGNQHANLIAGVGNGGGKIQIPNGNISQDPSQMGNPPEAWQFMRQLSASGTMDAGGSTISWGPDLWEVTSGGSSAWSGAVNGTVNITNVSGPNMSYLDPAGGGEFTINVPNFYAGIQAGTPPEEMDEFGGSNDTTKVTDMEVVFEPQDQDGVRLANEENLGGDIRIASDVRGQGGSIKADGQIRMVGVGFDIDAGAGDGENEGPGISLYAKDDVVLSTLQPDANGNHEYMGMELKGLVYSWKDIELKAGHEDELATSDPQRVFIQGAMVAYGGIPGDGNNPPGTNGGNILMTGDRLDLVFDPTHLISLRSETGLTVSLEPVSRSFR